jgi:hypothetical protein
MDGLVMAHPRTLLDVVFSILADGKPRSSVEILTEARRRRLVPSDETSQQINGALSRYIERALFHGRKPDIVEDPDHRFRLNRPVDDWPAIDTTGLAPLTIPTEPPASAAPAIIALRKAASGADSVANSVAFEKAVCGMFAVFGFGATHLGGSGAPDGYADALLGELRYRVMIECKLLGHRNLSESSAAAEAARYRDVYHAEYCALVAPVIDAEPIFAAELRTHGVSAWTVEDLARAAILRLDCSQLRPLFAQGFAIDTLDDVAWAQIHGPAKRLRVVASLLIEIGLAQQHLAQQLEDGAAGPRLTKDVALSLLDERLTTSGSTHGATLEEIDAAFTWLTSPYVGRAIWSDDSQAAIVIRPLLDG